MSLTDPSLPLQKALMKAMKEDPSIAPIIAGRVYDAPPAKANFPYVSIGPVVILPELGDETDAADTTVQIDVWSQAVGFVECKQIGAAIVALLHDNLLPIEDAGTVQSLLLETARYARDPDGLSSRGILTFNILSDANS